MVIGSPMAEDAGSFSMEVHLPDIYTNTFLLGDQM
jgi:hypothetical protein